MSRNTHTRTRTQSKKKTKGREFHDGRPRRTYFCLVFLDLFIFYRLIVAIVRLFLVDVLRFHWFTFQFGRFDWKLDFLLARGRLKKEW